MPSKLESLKLSLGRAFNPAVFDCQWAPAADAVGAEAEENVLDAHCDVHNESKEIRIDTASRCRFFMLNSDLSVINFVYY